MHIFLHLVITNSISIGDWDASATSASLGISHLEALDHGDTIFQCERNVGEP